MKPTGNQFRQAECTSFFGRHFPWEVFMATPLEKSKCMIGIVQSMQAGQRLI
jgi:hypothetical protein